MPNYTIEITDAGDEVIQLAFTTENTRLTAAGDEPYKTVDEFLEAQIVKEFGISDDELASAAKRQAIDAVVDTLQKLEVAEIATVAEAATTELNKKTPIEPIKNP